MASKTYVAGTALQVKAELGEGPVWDDRLQELHFVDILGHRVHSFQPTTGQHRSFEVGRAVGAIALRDDGGLLLAAEDLFLAVEVDGNSLVPYGRFSTADQRVRFNDGKVDPLGRFVAGTMDWNGEGQLGCLYMLGADGAVVTLLEEVGISNGLAWSPSGSILYYIDTPLHTVDAFDVDPATGTLSGRRTITEISDGNPDGMAIDDEGLLWVAVWGAYRVDRIDPANGRRVATIEVPTRHVSSVAFGGASLGDLYITTARAGLDERAIAADRQAGDLFVAHPGVTGPAPQRFHMGLTQL